VENEITLISAGAPQSGVMACIDVYCDDTDARFEASYMTSPEIKKVIEGDGSKPKILVAPEKHMQDYGRRELLDGDSVVRVGDVGVAVRTGADFPDVSSASALREAILAADSVLYNAAISGQYIANMIDGLGIADDVAAKTERFPSAAALMLRIGKGQGNEIGFGQIPAIRRLSKHGILVVAPLPDELSNTTPYVAGAINPNASRVAKGFLRFLETPRARDILDAAGIV
jgi:ABC-type molybdate transport system substrate-binding protein